MGDRVSVAFPGVVPAGRVLTAPNLSTKREPGTPTSPELRDAWAGYPLGAELQTRLRTPVRLANDADMHGLVVIAGQDLELVITLGTGLGTALFYNGTPTPHLELALVPYESDGTFQDLLGNQARRRIGNKRWSRRVHRAVETFDSLLQFDRALSSKQSQLLPTPSASGEVGIGKDRSCGRPSVSGRRPAELPWVRRSPAGGLNVSARWP
jgi:polyphosphate glucokinase